MLIQSFENQSNLAEFFEHIDHYSVVITRNKDNKRTEYKLQKIEYVYSMLKVKGSVTALVNCAKDLAVNFSYIPPTVNTDNKNLNSNENDPLDSSVFELQGFDKALGVVDSEGEALFSIRDLNTIVSALGHYIGYIEDTDLVELAHLNIDFEIDRKASIARLLDFQNRVISIRNNQIISKKFNDDIPSYFNEA